jgi:hypothetical protein
MERRRHRMMRVHFIRRFSFRIEKRGLRQPVCHDGVWKTLSSAMKENGIGDV